MDVEEVFDIIEKLPISNPELVKNSIGKAFDKMKDDADSQEMRETIGRHRNRVMSADSIDEIREELESLEEKRKELGEIS